MNFLKKLEMFKDLNGYLGAGVFTPEGKMLGGVTDVSGINFEIAGSLFHDTLLITDNRSKEAGFGGVNQMQVNTETGIFFMRCLRDEKMHFHTMLVVKKNTNIAMAKVMLNKVVEALKGEFTSPL
jgi:hypothetical protein